MILNQTLPVDLASAAVAEAARLWHNAGSTPGKAAAGRLQDCVAALTQHRNVVPVKNYFGQFAIESCKAPIAFVAGALLSKLVGVPFAIHSHEPLVDPSARADHESLCESASCLPSEVMTHGFPAVVKTVTMVVHAQQGKHFLSISSLGDVAVDDYTLHAISEQTGLSRTALKHHSHINTPEFDPLKRLGLEAGNIGPFPHHVEDVHHFILRQIDKPGYIAVRFTPRDTVCFARRLCQPLIISYLRMLGREYLLC